ncbi:putative serine/threonine-protein kinase PrkC [Clostridiales bacterium oral taxon 876 str. F0540]|nr:putative serine/threonine-protein kinase PrkC [Clostridiales bacterium oral taxon 876 str. F0540]
MIGTLLGNRYEIIEKIGEGGMSVVYKAKCHLLNRFVAVKVLKDEYSRDKEFVDKFKAEAAAAGSITHSNIVNIYDVGSQDGVNYIVMEYVHGKTLKEVIIQNGRLDYNRTLDISIQIAKAIECAHKNNIIHRDIKPQNILVTDEGVVKVTDFGIAKAANSVTITNTNKVMGSAHYFSPEQAKGSFVDSRTDIYSLGVVLYEMLTGRVPYDAESPVSVALKHLQEPVVPPKQLNSNIPDGLNNLIIKSMEKDPIARYQNIKDLLLDLQRIKNDSNYKVELGNSFDDYTRVMSPITNYDAEDSEPKKPSKMNTKKLILIMIPLAILVIAVGSFAGWYYMDKKFNPNKTSVSKNEVSVPAIKGLSENDARKAVEDKGLKLVVVDKQKSDSPEGTVITVSPEEGTTVKTNSEVRVYLSAGTGTTAIPSVKEMDIAAAIKLIESSGFTVGNKTYEPSDTIPKDSIISQNPEGDTQANPKSKVDLVISQGKKINYTTVPDLSGRTLTEAEGLLSSYKLKLGNKTKIDTNDPNENGKIVNQTPNADTKDVKEGSTVDVTYKVYKEPEKVTVPDFTKSTVANAKANSAGFNLIINGAADTDVVVGQSIAPNTQAPKGSSITLTTSKPDAQGQGTPTTKP